MTRLASMRRHRDALELALQQTTEQQFIDAAMNGPAVAYNQHVAPIENGFINLTNFVADLNEAALLEAGETPVNRPQNLKLLHSLGVIEQARVDRWRRLFALRNQLQHEYPDVAAGATYRAAEDLVGDLPGYLNDYGAWLVSRGFGSSQPPPSSP